LGRIGPHSYQGLIKGRLPNLVPPQYLEPKFNLARYFMVGTYKGSIIGGKDNSNKWEGEASYWQFVPLV